MINESNFKDLLNSLGFKRNEEINEVTNEETFEKKFPEVNAVMSVSFDRKKLYFPNEIKGGERNNNFDKPENFVVFECVHRLLAKGYRPESIELEREWQLGHDPKGGRSDICVANDDGSTLFIIECKTWGQEFDRALNKTKSDGDQLFSYWQQEQACKWLALYASNFQENNIEYKSPTVDCSDDVNNTLRAQKDKSIRLYRDAHTTSEKYNVWKETYDCKTYENLIFSEESVAYQIGVKPLLKKDLRDFTPEDKIVNKFEEILRHNNVSDKENAFNRLIALFICKLVDESTKGEEDEVEFQYKPGTDTYESLQDRLQRLHCEGMKKFMREEIYYVSADYPEQLFSNYTGQKRKQAIKDLQNTIRILKFYSNNDFAFKDVHNEELFYQNGKILVETVQLFEKYRIVYPSKHQFLGDLFEQLLNKGFKQNEGQFFTPMPITRFIWDSLPVSQIIKSDRGTVYPKVVDYACGAGHFLTEAVGTIDFFVDKGGDNAWVKDCIYGIEKDYRLARVSKISLFMNGAGEGNIIFGDGLENAPDKGIKNGTFDILVSNPPYSVKDFKQHLQLKNNSFDLLNRIGLNGSEIETLFVERIGQLLKPNGIAAVILPSSILSNDSVSYTGAREQILQNFYIHAIVALGSKTFGATGTNTVILFLEKFNEPPKKISLYRDTVEAVFSGSEIADWKDQEILEAYLSQNEIEYSTYISFLNKEYSIEELRDNNYFKMYVTAFSGSAEVKNLIKTKSYRQKNEDDRATIYLGKFYDYAFEIEKDKLFYFSLVYQQNTVVITAPSDNKEQKEFLGYDWSNRKGNEGIQINSPGGKMYNDSDRAAKGTLAAAIRESFDGDFHSFTEEQEQFVKVINTKDMLDYSRAVFNKSIRLSINKSAKLESKYPLQVLGEVCDVTIGGTPSRRIPEYFTGTNLWVSIAEMRGQIINDTKEKITDEAVDASNVKLIPAGTTLLSFKLSIGKTAIAGRDLYTNEAIAALIPLNNSQILDKYIFYVFTGKLIDLADVGDKAFGKSLNSDYLKNNIKIPVPPISVQQEIITECEKIDEEYNQTRMSIEEYNNKINALFNELDVISTGGGYRLSLTDATKFSVAIGKRVLDRQLISDGQIPVYSANVIEPFGYINELLITDFSIPSVLWGIDGDWMTRYMPENIEFYPTDHCGVLRCNTQEVNPRYMAHILETEGEKMGFSRSYRASIDRIQGITFTVTDRETQDRYIEEINSIEDKIKDEQDKLLSLNGKISGILENFLN